MPESARKAAEATLHSIEDSVGLAELLPYVLDPHGPGSRLSVRRQPNTVEARSRKRAEGVFYTPEDVADYMVREALHELSAGAHPLTVFDPACGTGVFLRSALKELRRQSMQCDALDLACSCLYGADIDPWALDAAAFVLLHACIQDVRRRKIAPIAAWHAIRLNLAHVDTLRLDPYDARIDDTFRSERLDVRSRLKTGEIPKAILKTVPAALPHATPVPINRLFPELVTGPRVIVGNPPYADVGYRKELLELSCRFETLRSTPKPNADLYPLFVEQMIRLAAPDAHGGALVLPLSIACNSGPQFRATRGLISRTSGRWRFAFFDREPHALFGEDVKTRNAIVLWSKTTGNSDVTLCTGPLQKWRGDRRAGMFKGIRFTSITNDIRMGIPKVHRSMQAKALDTLLAQERTVEQAVLGLDRSTLLKATASDGLTVHVGATAYNFLSVFIDPELPPERRQHALSENPLHTMACSNARQAFAVFAALSGHLAFWWWHVNGDGFHVSRRTLASFPIGTALLDPKQETALVSLGEHLWKSVKSQPIFSLNRGRLSMGFSSVAFHQERREIDTILTQATGLDSTFVDVLEGFSQSIRTAQSLDEDRWH